MHIAPPVQRFLECSEDDLRLSEVRDLLSFVSLFHSSAHQTISLSLAVLPSSPSFVCGSQMRDLVTRSAARSHGCSEGGNKYDYATKERKSREDEAPISTSLGLNFGNVTIRSTVMASLCWKISGKDGMSPGILTQNFSGLNPIYSCEALPASDRLQCSVRAGPCTGPCSPQPSITENTIFASQRVGGVGPDSCDHARRPFSLDNCGREKTT